MTATSVLLILIGIFIIVNSTNLVGVFKGEKSFSFQGAKSTTAASTETTKSTSSNSDGN